ncbi:hypothetical protein VTL71DRAFT_10992 [Oculimacula yallundae]|uniref:Uncharacterized protein n=1 Tax=Oculimacula yallundae TaxID=86028 RepID=A0ABR4CWX0_9HELO
MQDKANSLAIPEPGIPPSPIDPSRAPYHTTALEMSKPVFVNTSAICVSSTPPRFHQQKVQTPGRFLKLSPHIPDSRLRLTVWRLGTLGIVCRTPYPSLSHRTVYVTLTIIHLMAALSAVS